MLNQSQSAGNLPNVRWSQSTYQRDFQRYPIESYVRPQSSHGAMRNAGIHSVPSKPRLGEIFLASHHLKISSLDGINDAKTLSEATENCAITSMAALFGVRSSQIAKGGTQDLSFFTQGRPVSLMESYKEQGHGMISFIKENDHGKFSSMSNQMGKGMREREAVIEMKKFPIGTQFLVYTEGQIQGSHWLYAERQTTSVKFFNYQFCYPKDLTPASSSGAESADTSRNLSDLDNSEMGSRRNSDHSESLANSDSEHSIYVAPPAAFRYEEGVLNNNDIEISRPHPVKYSGRERFLLEPFLVRFIAVVPKF